jgi:hypothetical protein
MLKETYIAKMKETAAKNPEAVFIVVTRSAGHVLSPSWKLLNDYKDGRIDWNRYTLRFRAEMAAAECREEMKRIWDLSQKKDVFLVCYEKPPEHCHRYLLIDMMQALFLEESAMD